MKLNLEVKNSSQQIVLDYLEQNASEALKEKINNGVKVQKDGKQLLSKKTLDGCMDFCRDEAKKIAEKGATYASVTDDIVFGWAMHYFEEDSIEGKLYNPDGTIYKPEVKKTQKGKTTTATVPKTVEPPKPKETQYSLFDMMTVENQPEKPAQKQEKPTLDEILEYNIDDEHDNDTDEDEDCPSSEEEQEVLVETQEQKTLTPSKPEHPCSPLYVKYMEQQNKYPDAVILYRLGDFYEAFGDKAVKLADLMDLTLTGRDFGLESRVPMVGFPYHAADNYLLKIHANYDLVVIEKEDNIQFLPKREKKQEPKKHWIDESTYVDEDGVMYEVTPQIPQWIQISFKDKIIAR